MIAFELSPRKPLTPAWDRSVSEPEVSATPELEADELDDEDDAEEADEEGVGADEDAVLEGAVHSEEEEESPLLSD